MSTGNQPHNYDAEGGEKISVLAARLNALLAQGATGNQMRYLYGEDVTGFIEDRLTQQSPNARTITTFARKVSDDPRFQYVAISKTLEDNQPDQYAIYFLDNHNNNHAIVRFNSRSGELTLINSTKPNEKDYITDDTLSLYLHYFSREKMVAIMPDNSVELSTCFRLMETIELDYGK